MYHVDLHCVRNFVLDTLVKLTTCVLERYSYKARCCRVSIGCFEMVVNIMKFDALILRSPDFQDRIRNLI